MMYNNAMMRFWQPQMGAPNMGTNVPNMGMLPMPFEGGMPRTPYKQPWWGMLPTPTMGGNSLVGAQNALLGLGGGSRGSGMMQRY